MLYHFLKLLNPQVCDADKDCIFETYIVFVKIGEINLFNSTKIDSIHIEIPIAIYWKLKYFAASEGAEEGV